VPVVSQLSGAAEQGALLTLEADPAEQGELLAELAARLLAGARPAEIPLQIPRRVSLVVNLKVARELGVEVPFSLLVQTTRLIR
jgi:putative ABC transport system substrate-binding protein